MVLVTPLVTVSELSEALNGPAAPLLLDVRWQLGSRTGASEYAEAHLPGAVFIDLDEALSGPVLPDGHGGRHPVPTVEHFTRAMRAAGVRRDQPVVCYDAGNSLPASRAWWMLTFFGHPAVRVLDGGLTAWLDAGLPVEEGVVEPEPGDFVVLPSARRLLDADGAARHPLLLDARPVDRFRGENETIDPVAGHIPGARSVPALDNLQADGRFLPAPRLVERFRAAGVEPGTDVGVYCGSGVQAAHTALALQHAGLSDDAAVYVGSWSDWVSDPRRPVELG